jgi:hypothetical protein
LRWRQENKKRLKIKKGRNMYYEISDEMETTYFLVVNGKKLLLLSLKGFLIGLF